MLTPPMRLSVTTSPSESPGQSPGESPGQTRIVLVAGLSLLLAALLWLTASSVQAQEQGETPTDETPTGETLTLDSTVRKMLKQNGEFLAVKFQQKADNFGRISAISELFPSVNIRASSGLIHREYTLTTIEDGTETKADPFTDADTDINITVSQPLYSRRFYRVGERFADHKSSKYRLHARANEFVLETIEAYLEVQTAGEQRQYAEKNLQDIRRLFNRVKARARVDPGQRYLLNRAQTRLSLGEEDLSKARQLEAARRSKLARLIGQDFGTLEAVP